MVSFEWLAAIYFGTLGAAAPWTDAVTRQRLRVMLGSAAVVVAIVVAADRGSATLRAWLPHVYLLCGYWMPALLAPSSGCSSRFERWLVRSDATFRPRLPSVPTAVSSFVELAYLMCAPLVPASFAVLWTFGTAEDVNRFWLAVLGSGYACYGSLPWLVSRPPRFVGERMFAPGGIGRLNVTVLSRVSHQLNTFPSGHVAVSVAAAVSVLRVSIPAGAVFALLAAAIAIGAGAGRYHYVVDIILGGAVSALVLTIVAAIT